MKRSDLVLRVRSITRDYTGESFREVDIVNYLNESVDRITQVIGELSVMPYLEDKHDSPTLFPRAYQHLLAVYSASRCFAQDDRYHQATSLMNEFEFKLAELASRVLNGEVILYDAEGKQLEGTYQDDHVVNNYFESRTGHVDIDDGVEGVR